MIDTHCHLFSEYYDNIEEIIEKAKANGILKIIVNGCDMKSNLEIINLVKKYDIVYGAIGFHPNDIADITEKELEWLDKNINTNKIVAVGEIGLDYHYEDTDKTKQKEILLKQLQIAKKYNKPVIIHSRDCIGETYNILKDSKVKGIIHCYSGSVEMAKEFTKIGFFIGVGGIITFKNAKNIKEVIKNIPLEYITLETDAPYLTPEPYRKYKNDSSYIPVIARAISEIKNVDIKEIAEVTTTNVFSLFDF